MDWDFAGKSVDRFTHDLEQRKNPQAGGRGGRGGQTAAPPITDPVRQGEPVEVLERLVEQLPKAKRYTDYREMLAQQKDIDAVIIATPDHMHATIASAAMDLGKHVYVQKPLTWSVEEARLLASKAKDKKIATQMGNQGHSGFESRTTVEYIQEGAIGDVKEVHVWTNRPLGYWPQGLPRPNAAADGRDQRPAPAWNGPGVEKRLAAAMAGNYPVPDKLNWDLFLGVAPQVDYHPVYHPFNWRGWVDWGQGALGDMGAHLIDFPFWALELGMPTSVETISTPFNDVCFPNSTTTYFEFAARGNKPAVKMTWYDGGMMPPRPAEFSDEMVERNGRMVYKDQFDRRRRRHVLRQQGQAAARHLRLQAAPAAAVAARLVRHAEAEDQAHPDDARDELGGRGQGHDRGVEPVRVRRAPGRSDAARRGLAPRADEDLLRRREHARDQLDAGQRPAPPRLPQRLQAHAVVCHRPGAARAVISSQLPASTRPLNPTDRPF